jgi:hypothetical protein
MMMRVMMMPTRRTDKMPCRSNRRKHPVVLSDPREKKRLPVSDLGI